MSVKKGVKKIIGAVINAKLGLISFGVNFSIVYYLNHEFGFVQALQAGLTGGLGSFFMGGIFGRISERFSEIRNPLVAYPLGSVVPTLLAYTFIFAAHVITGTPRPEVSSLVPMFISMFINTPATMFMLRRGYFRQNQEKPAVKDRVWEKKQQRRKEKEERKRQKNEFNNGTDENYKILGLTRAASFEEIKTAYKTMAKQFHPDSVSHLGEDSIRTANEKFPEITKAYDEIKKERGF